MSSANILMQPVVENLIDDHVLCAHSMTQIDLTLVSQTLQILNNTKSKDMI